MGTAAGDLSRPMLGVAAAGGLVGGVLEALAISSAARGVGQCVVGSPGGASRLDAPESREVGT